MHDKSVEFNKSKTESEMNQSGSDLSVRKSKFEFNPDILSGNSYHDKAKKRD